MLYPIVLLSCLSGVLPRLVMVHLIFRHGDRSPWKFYPTDPNKSRADWIDGPGVLTNLGKQMCFELGQWIREEFDGFLSEEYKAEEVRVLSDDTDRTIMSAQSVLAGLFPPKGRQVWHEGFNWQPVPVHSVPREINRWIGEHQPCERIEQLEKELQESSYMQDTVFGANKDLFAYLSRYSGRNISNVNELAALYDTLQVDYIYNKSLPAWTESVFPGGKFEQLSRLSFTADTFNDELKRLKAGPFFSELLSHYNLQERGSADKLSKVMMYSTHDTNLVRIMNSLGVYNNQPPPYASMLIFSLHKEDDQFKVSISLRNNTNSPPYPLTLPGCDQDCQLKDFRKLTMDVTPDNWDLECKVISKNNKKKYK